MKVISKNNISEFTTEKSKFISYVFFVTTKEEVEKYLEILKKEHRKARHIAYSYRIGYDELYEYYTDDGEPSLTAGLPIYNVIDKNKLTFVLIAVVRYFGGVKLGTGGLKRAYEKGANDVATKTRLFDIKKYQKISIEFDYKYLKIIENILCNHIIIDRDFSDLVKLYFYKNDESIIKSIIDTTNNNVTIEYMDEEIVNINNNKKIDY